MFIIGYRLHHHALFNFISKCILLKNPSCLEHCCSTLLSLASYSSTSLFLSCLSSSTRSVKDSTCNERVRHVKGGLSFWSEPYTVFMGSVVW